MNRGRRRHGPPPWWPEGEAFPPRHGRPPWARARFLRGFAAIFLGMVVLLAATATLAGWLTAALLGLVPAPGAVRVAGLFALLLALLAVLAGLRGFRRFASPFSELVEAAHRVEAGEYGVRVSERGWGDMRSLARAFNAMSARLAASDARRRGFLADVTHELKTPLSVIRGQAEGVVDGLYPAAPESMAPILDATQSLELLVEDLRTLALSDAGSLSLAREPVDLAVLVNETLAGLSPQARAAGVELAEAVAPATPSVDADPARLRGVLANLITNALRHTPPGGHVRVAAARAGELVEVSVSDDGEGVPPELADRVFERFVKGEGSRGTGLGLAIARDVVTAHGGSIALDSRAGAGTRVRFTLPVA